MHKRLAPAQASNHTRAAPNRIALASSAQTATDIAEFQRQMDADMVRMMQDMHGPGNSGDPDIDFLTMMIPHHQGAVDMARLVLVFGADPLTRSIAEGIISNQQTEILAMKSRLAVLKGQQRNALPEYPALNGTRGTEP